MPSDSKPAVAAPSGEPPTDLVVDDLEVGAGDEAQAGQDVEVHYVGEAWSTGNQFDASWDRGQTFTFRLGYPTRDVPPSLRRPLGAVIL